MEIEPPPPRRGQGAGGPSTGGAATGPGGTASGSGGAAQLSSGSQAGAISGMGSSQAGAMPGMGGTQSGAPPGMGGTQPAGMPGMSGAQTGTMPGMGGAQSMSMPGMSGAQSRPTMPMGTMSMARFVGSPSLAPPGFEEPCKCEAECCQMPSEPRRPLPIFHLPMVFHYGCCGCVECPPSLNPYISFRIRYTMMMARRMGMIPVLDSEGELPDVISR